MKLNWRLVFAVMVLVAVLVTLTPPSPDISYAADEKKVAVLELTNKSGITEDEAYSLTDQVRIVASQALPATQFIVMTSENIQDLLPPDVDLKKCTDAQCEVEIGRMVGAEYIVTGEIIRFAGDLRINLKVHNASSGHFVGGLSCEGAEVRGLEDNLKGVSRQLMDQVLTHAGVQSSAPSGGDAVFVSPTQLSAPSGAAEVRALAPTEQPPATATGPAGLYITSDPPGADVYLGQTKAGTTNPAFQKINLQAGSNVRVTLKMDLYHDVAFDVQLKPGVMKFDKVELKPAFGSLKIESEPSGAEVYIGGEKVGTTPFTEQRYPSGQYLVTVKKEWYLPQEDQQITVSDGQATTKMATLSQDFGTLEVASDPSGAEVTLDGKKLGTTPGSWRVPPVQNGKVRVFLAKHRDSSFEITIDRDQTVKITAEQATLQAKLGSLQVYADPPLPGAKVFVDGKEVGTAPFTLNQIQEGVHKIEVKVAGKSGGESVSITEGQTTVATVMLQVSNPANINWIQIPAGTFIMGSNTEDKDEKPAHRVTVSTFEMSETEVTVAQYRTCVDAGACTPPKGGRKYNWEKSGYGNRPINGVEWDQAVAFATWAGGRLPTEAEWEYAARAGTTTRYACGESDSCVESMGWYSKNSGHQTQSVGSKRANSWGLRDMHGNVYEWVSDKFGNYSSDSVTDPTGPTSGSRQVIRGGGCFNAFPRDLRSTNRHGNKPKDIGRDVGFRLAK
jgi:formylglycine-generating enzyme required for sulfatase activity/TolB-like protein